jgi:hypothetical protein
MRAETASRAPHARKHGTTFAESWTSAVDEVWWDAGDRRADALLHRSAEHDASAAIVAFA